MEFYIENPKGDQYHVKIFDDDNQEVVNMLLDEMFRVKPKHIKPMEFIEHEDLMLIAIEHGGAMIGEIRCKKIY